MEFNSSYRILGGYRVAQLRTLSGGPHCSNSHVNSHSGVTIIVKYLRGHD